MKSKRHALTVWVFVGLCAITAIAIDWGNVSPVRIGVDIAFLVLSIAMCVVVVRQLRKMKRR